MSFVFLVIGTILSVLFIIMLFKGSSEDYLLESLSGDAFPLKSIYTVGLAWQSFPFASLRGTVGDHLRNEAALLYSKKYSEYYARIIWAQTLSFSHLILALFLTAAGATSGAFSAFLLIVGIFFCAIVIYYFMSSAKNKVSDRTAECEREFPNAISKMALIVNSGVILRDAWFMVAEGNSGAFYELMQESCNQMRNGTSEIDAIHNFGVLCNSDDVKKFASALIQSIERGGGDLPQFLANQSSELWAARRQTMLQKGEKAAGALLMPIALMFFGVLLIVISAAMQSFSI